MKAVVIDSPGGLDALSYRDVPVPVATSDQIRKELSNADFSWLLGLPVSALVYFLLARRDVIASRFVARARVDEAASLGEEGTLLQETAP